MLLLTKENRAKLPPLYAQEEKGDDAIVYIKYFTPWTYWTWYITEGSAVVDKDGECEHVPLANLENKGGTLCWTNDRDEIVEVVDVRFFGLVQGFEVEWGYVLLSELEAQRGPFGLKIERDLYYAPQTIEKVKAQMAQST